MPLASLLIGNDVKMAILLDADKAGTAKQKELKEKLLVDCILINSITDENKTEIEDLFPEKLYLDAVHHEYKDINLDFTIEEKKTQGITKKLNSLFERQGKKFEKWIPTNLLIDWIRQDSKEHEIPQQTCEFFKSIFKTVNKTLN